MRGKSIFTIDDKGRECTICEQYKSWDNFYETECKSTGHRANCKDCCRSVVKEQRAKFKSSTVHRFTIMRTHLKPANSEHNALKDKPNDGAKCAKIQFISVAELFQDIGVKS